MTEYLPSFIVEPVLRQARRLSRLSSGEESPGFLPAVPESFRTWYPSRLWTTSPPPSLTEDEHQESTFQQIARNIQLWTNQIPSPPLEPMDDTRPEEIAPEPSHNAQSTTFPPLDSEPAPQSRPVHLAETRTESETSLNPLRELADRSRVYEDGPRGQAQSGPVAAASDVDRSDSISLDFNNEEYNRRRDGSGILPEDDGMGPLRQRINAIWAGDGTSAEKSRLIHVLMMERYRLSQARAVIPPNSPANKIVAPDRSGTPTSMISGASQEVVFNISPSDLVPTFAPIDHEEVQPDGSHGHTEEIKPELGCVHYKRNVKIQCNECERWYTCRLCHDEAENHVLPRRETKHMLCMLCNTPQSASQTCKMCGEHAASYYCSICKLWSDDTRKSIYHCDDCGICRLGQGLGKDFFHCKKCAACMSIQAEATHRCIEKSTKCDCPICGEYLFTSSKSVAFMRCGHSIHETCFADWCNTSYKCPLCSKSITNMESQFRRLDRSIADQPMPDEYRDTRAYIFCNDCAARSVTKYHWLGLKCERCESYNTAQLQLLGPTDASRVQQQNEIAATAEAIGQSDHSEEQISGDSATPVPPPATVVRSAEVNRYLLPRSPTARSVSPIVGSYFDTDRRDERARRGTPMEDDENLEFWGGRSPPQHEIAGGTESDGEESEEISSSSDEVMEDEEGEEDGDAWEIFGHR